MIKCEDANENKDYFKLIDPIDEAELSTQDDLCNLSRKDSVIQSVKHLSKDNLCVRFIVYLVFTNPFIKLLVNLFKQPEERKGSDNDRCIYDTICLNFEDLLNDREKRLVNLVSLSLLMIFNLVIFTLVSDALEKVFLLLINNIYLLYLVYSKHQEENSIKGAESSSYVWDSFVL